ncbi:thiol-disulfide oxidoreductase DCC family protein [Kordiimonas gwangyangensis]|uniref:thiol-disulfide oxidoreductase DCC family protein n=1 Tax=Kordiimonas gwangyangensis TaxID=288022 RepID=UPI000369F3D9|nr:DCC1-like thiol-disulfide oxidoreductase family protein [Kordiimonas gwangyangensis]
MNGPILFYDGVCNLCNGTVRFVLTRDSKQVFRFAALQSDYARDALTRLGVNPELDTIYLLKDGVLHDRSSAALRIASQLRFPWPTMAVFLIVPKPLRDTVYNWVGRNRYRWFGRTDTCQIPDTDARNRFLDQSED